MKTLATLTWMLFFLMSECSAVFCAPNRVQEATDLILKLCLADGTENIEVVRKGSSVQVSGDKDSVTITRKESSGLAGGISKSITELSAQQASEARSCTQKYLQKLLDIILSEKDPDLREKPDEAIGTIHIMSPPGPQCSVNFQIILGNQTIIPHGPDWIVPDIKLGLTKWIIRGTVQCYADFCNSNSDNQSGDVFLQNGGSYVFYWNIIPGSPKGSECHFLLH